MAGTSSGVVFCCFLFYVNAGLLGSRSDVDITDPTVQELADLATTKIEAASNSMYRSKLVEITKAHRQVAAGWNYYLTLRVGSTKCRKGGEDNLEGCEVHEEQSCDVTLLIQAWLNKKEVTHFECKPIEKSAPVPMPGASLNIDRNSPEIKTALDYAIEVLNERHDHPKRAMISDVIHAKSQVVSGVKYEVTVHLAESRCLNTEENKGASLEKCPLSKKEEIEECNLTIVHTAWMTPEYTVGNAACTLKANPYHYRSLLANKVINKMKNVDSYMDQSHNEINKPMLGGDGHDIASWGAFSVYMKQYNKDYKDKREAKLRFKNFRRNMKKIQQYNAKEQGTAVYGATEFADLTEEEWRKMNPRWNVKYDPTLPQAEIPTKAAPDSFDWRDHNAVTEVKNQGSCGSCWAFSTTGNIEGQWAIKKKKLISLSEQELVDCDKIDQGCDGGLPTDAYKEIKRLGGLETEKDYPYEGEDEKCSFKTSEARVYVNSSVNITQDEEKMAAWLASNGPISIGINAAMMQFYFGGVSHPWKFFCDPEELDHGVLIVGYGTKSGYFSTSPYWIVKNSWGASWGEKGYYLVYRGDGTCGLNQMCSSAVIN